MRPQKFASGAGEDKSKRVLAWIAWIALRRRYEQQERSRVAA